METDGTTMLYTKAEALVISWQDGGRTQQPFKDQRDKLGQELEAYNFGVETFDIPSAKPYQTLFRKLNEFLSHDDQGTLLVVYYGGHGEKIADNQLVWLRDEPYMARDLRGIPQVNWSALQTLFLHECASPVLFLLDCCYAGASVHREQSSSTVVALAATGFHDVAPVRGKDSFTTFLTRALKAERDHGRSVHVAYLKTLISAMLNNPDMLDVRGPRRRVTPDYFPFSNGFITLRVLPTRVYRPAIKAKTPHQRLERTNLDVLPELASVPQTLDQVPDTVRPQVIQSSQSGTLTEYLGALSCLNAQSGLNAQSEVLKTMWSDENKGQRIHGPPADYVDNVTFATASTLLYRRTPSPPSRHPLPVEEAPPSKPPSSGKFRTPNKYFTFDESPSKRVAERRLAFQFPDAVPSLVNQDENSSKKRRREPSAEPSEASDRTDLDTNFRPSNEYRYSPVPSGSIRLIGIYPGGQQEPMNCFTDIRELTTSGEQGVRPYTALSWRPDSTGQDSSRQVAMRRIPGWSAKLFVTDDHSRCEVAIHPSLLDALRQIRDVRETVIFWVDQLCINWTDEKEAETQLELIPQIFRQASYVTVWLGSGSIDSSAAMKFITDLLNLDLVDTLVKEHSTPVKWQALVNLIQRPYFSRRWVFLELMLAKRAVLYCGSDIVDWADFADAVVILGSRFDEVKLLQRRRENSELDSLVDPRSLPAYSIVEASREHFRRQGDGTSLATCNLEMLVSRLPALQSWHPAAIIYALLPLATDRDLWTYGESENPSEVFQQFVMHCTKTSHSLDIICRPWAPRTDRKGGGNHRPQYGMLSKNERLPSWIRQVRHLPFGEGSKTGRNNGDLFIGQPNRPYYAAAAGSIATPIFGRISEGGDPFLNGSMTVSGFVVGGILKSAGRSQDGTLPRDWIEMFDWQASESLYGVAGDQDFVPDQLWRTLVADRGPGGTPAPLWYHQACRHWLVQYPESDITTSLIRDRPHSSMALQFIQRVRSVIWNRALFTTVGPKGSVLFGLGPPEVRDGQTVCILHGCSVPVILEQVKNSWVLVGECFVYGIMDGEAMQMSECIGQTQEFLLL
ncbi:hypothetical protein CONLIGDRAFT_482534 [Coniochaeta ligniaria NRRL 30616]|uniref:Uncharacterized protein n=1 Tax=Coniochaeta ligniaria NRRL 30616 TaxID=1408157 RepID=A0A1J7JBP6_9PEZI|nr:hypothetical protein CONLIGDRAFT_482534 [Coniochaeta ligniaria NRRL 30616]